MLLKRALFPLIAATSIPLGGCVIQGGDNYTAPRASAQPVAQPAAPAPKKAKNVILFIGDGMGISTITAARIYEGQKRGETGEENLLSFENFDNVALVKTYNTNAQVPDSAGTATAMHSGQKTNIGLIGVGPDTIRSHCETALANPLPLLGEEVKRRGLALGIVSTARITHATPASVYARSADRNWEADAAIREDQKGKGCKDIATQLIEADWDVALGGGSMAFFGENKGGGRIAENADLPAQWAARTGGTFVTDRPTLEAASVGKPVLGLFTKSHMTYTAEREEGTKEPTLTDLTAQAITRLKADPDGYYLMVEAGRIDHAHHWGRAGVALEETVELARAVQYALDNTDPEETLILVTADHSHVFTMAGYPRRGNDILGLVVPPEGELENPDEPALAEDKTPYTTLGYSNGPGAVTGLAKRPFPEIGIMARQQSTVPLRSETHGGEDVALYAQGPGAEQVRGVIEQNRIYHFIRKAFGWE
jgi:alkaline phosphatase